MTGRIIPIDPNGHRDVRRLLPWYVTGALEGVERAAIEAHLAQCAECRAEADAEEALAEQMRALPIGAGLDEARGWAAMRQRLDAEGARTAAPVDRLRAWLGALARGWSGAEPWMRWAVAAQACLVLALAGAFVWRDARTPAYQVLGEEGAAPRANVLVIFRPETTEQELRTLVRASGGRLVGGPTEANAYLLRALDPERGLAGLRGRPQVLLAEPIDPDPVP
jgi:anti-sigma-K factor RskA